MGTTPGLFLTDKDLSILKHKCLENVNSLARVDGSAANGLVSWYLNERKMYQSLILRSIKSDAFMKRMKTLEKTDLDRILK